MNSLFVLLLAIFHCVDINALNVLKAKNIVTPTGTGGSQPMSPPQQQPSTGMNPPGSAVGSSLPAGVPSGGNSPPNTALPSPQIGPGAATPPGSSSPSGVSPAGQPQSGLPPAGSPPAGATSPGSSPPSGVPPAGLPPSGLPPAGSSPAGSPPPRSPPAGSSPAGTPPAGSPPPLMGNIMMDPGLLPLPRQDYDISDTVIVSAEIIDNSIGHVFDKKCEDYTSRIPSAKSQNGLPPVVMIYGGMTSKDTEFPHMAALGYGDPNHKQWLCGGSLISQRFVVTAAHCISSQPLGDVKYVKLGGITLDESSIYSRIVNVDRTIVHEQYSSSTHYYDIALIQTDQTIEINNYIAPICLFPSTDYEDKNLVATGWGRTESASVSSTLHKVGLEIFTQPECQNAYRAVSAQQLPLGIQEEIQLCAGSHSQSKDTCQGDSGGPLQIRKNNRWYLIGITSIGINCGIVNVPGVYTRVATFIPWIEQHVWRNK